MKKRCIVLKSDGLDRIKIRFRLHNFHYLTSWGGTMSKSSYRSKNDSFKLNTKDRDF